MVKLPLIACLMLGSASLSYAAPKSSATALDSHNRNVVKLREYIAKHQLSQGLFSTMPRFVVHANPQFYMRTNAGEFIDWPFLAQESTFHIDLLLMNNALQSQARSLGVRSYNSEHCIDAYLDTFIKQSPFITNIEAKEHWIVRLKGATSEGVSTSLRSQVEKFTTELYPESRLKELRLVTQNPLSRELYIIRLESTEGTRLLEMAAIENCDTFKEAGRIYTGATAHCLEAGRIQYGILERPLQEGWIQAQASQNMNLSEENKWVNLRYAHCRLLAQKHLLAQNASQTKQSVAIFHHNALVRPRLLALAQELFQETLRLLK